MLLAVSDIITRPSRFNHPMAATKQTSFRKAGSARADIRTLGQRGNYTGLGHVEFASSGPTPRLSNVFFGHEAS